MKLDFVILSKKFFLLSLTKKKDCAIICLFQKYFKCFVIKNKNFNEKKNILNFYSLSLSLFRLSLHLALSIIKKESKQNIYLI